MEEPETAPGSDAETWRHVLGQLSSIRKVMQDVAVAVKVINYMNIHGGVGGKGGAGGEQGGGGGVTGKVPVSIMLWRLGTSPSSRFMAQDRSDNDKQIIFQGRQDILEKMAKYFSADPGQRHTYVLHGLGGSGKTQIALKFLDMMNRYQTPRFTKQFFINASSRQTLDTAFTNIAISQGMGKTSEDGTLWLISQVEEWMLLFDNADDPNINLFPFFPRCTHGNIIITSRNPELAGHGPQSYSKVGDMDETNAIDLLLLRAMKKKTIETTQQASEIVKELSCLPLAVIQAGAYISKFNCLPRYLLIYRKNRANILEWRATQSHDDYELTVYTTWQISFKQLSKVAAQFLKLCSLLHHNNIPEAIFKQAAEWKTNDVGQEAQILQAARGFLQNFLSASGTWDQQCLMDIVAEIQGYSLIDRHDIGDTLSIHPLVHSWCQDTLVDEPIARECMTDIIGMSVRLTEDAYQGRIGLMSHIDSLIPDLAAIKSMFHTEYARIYFDSGRFKEAEDLDAMVLEKRKQLLGADHPDTLQAMANLAATYRQLGRYKEAEPLESTVLEKQKQLLGADHPDTLWAMANLAATYRQLGRYKEAEPLESTVLEKRKQLLGADHPDTLWAMANLAATYGQLGRYKEAEPLESTVLEKQKQLLGADHPDTLRTMANLAATYGQLGRYKEAEPLESTVLEKRKQLLGADHPDTLRAMGNLAATYRQLGRYKEAEPLESTVLEKRKQLLGADHPDTLWAMANLAATYGQLGRYKEAEPLESTVLEKRKQLLGADHPDTLWAMANLAATYRQLGRYKEAEPLESTVLEKQKQLLGADHPDTLRAMANLAATYHQLGRYKEAEPLESTVLEKRNQLLGADHPDTLRAMANLAATYRQLGRYKEAEPLESTVLEKRNQLLGADHPDTLRAMANLAATYGQLGRYKEAEPLESTVLEKQKQLLGADHPDTLWAMANLAVTYHQLGRYKEAEPLESTVLEKWKQLLGADHPDTLWAMANLAVTYHQLGRYKEAEPLESTVLEKRKQLLGADHPDTLWAMANLAATYRQLGRYKEAEPLESTVLEKRKQLLGADHPDTLWAMANLAVTYHQLGRYKEAEPLESTVLEKRKQLLGADHPDTLRAMANLAATYGQLGRYKEAEPLESTVLEKQKQLLGADHPDTLRAMANLAATYHQLGRAAEFDMVMVSPCGQFNPCVQFEHQAVFGLPMDGSWDIMELITAKEPTFAERLSLILDIAFGLQYLHKETIVHGNLKANAFSLMLAWFNILVTTSDRACMADFGLSRIAKAVNMGFNHSTVNAGMAHYQASESFKATNLAQMTLCKVGFLEGLDRWKIEGGWAVFVPRRIKIQEEMKERECERLVKLEEGKAVNM
ncbi:putative kinesin [Mycena olivaceomarginata]|nr:putative kinesin [Mycena olivaceomarginata]